MELNVLKLDSSTAPLSVSDLVFGRPFNEPLIHQAVIAHLAGARSGTRAQKTRGEVSGSTRKPWKQKGSGRARAGSVKSPLWRHGGVIFAAKPQDHSQKVNRKMYRGAMTSILSELLRTGRLQVVEDFSVVTGKTKDLVKKLADMALTGKTLIVTQLEDTQLFLASRNLHTVDVRPVSAIDPVCLIAFDNVVLTQQALKSLEERLG